MNNDLKTMLLAVEAVHATGKANTAPAPHEIAEAFYATKRALVHALNGHVLLGLPNLGTQSTPWHGLNLSGAGIARTISFPDRNLEHGPWVLALDEKAQLVIVRAERFTDADRARGALAAGEWFYFTSRDEPALVKPYLNGRGLSELVGGLPRALGVHLEHMRQRTGEASTAIADAKAFVAGLEDGGRS